jgi:hypothetical protein
MFKARLVLLSLVAVLSFVVMASSASAAIKFEWKVGGKTLEKTTESREFTVTSDGHSFDLHTTLAGSNILFLTSEVSVKAGAKIFGGKPGTGLETVIFKGVTINTPKCVVESEGASPGTVETHPILIQIVSNDLTPAEPLILFNPDSTTSSIFVAYLLLNKSSTETCVFAGQLSNITGNLLALPLPQLTETLNGDLDFEAPDTHFVLSNGTLESAGLLFAGNAFTLTGLTLRLLKTDEKYGAF